MDLNTLRALQNQDDCRPPHFIVPLNNESILRDLDCRGEEVVIHSLDWWQSRVVGVNLPGVDSPVPMSFEITCVPSQHQSNRAIRDRNHSLWCGFTVTSVTQTSLDAMSESESLTLKNIASQIDRNTSFSCFFAGDTGYGYVSAADQKATTTCPAFKQIGERFNGFDLALLPIGSVHHFIPS